MSDDGFIWAPYIPINSTDDTPRPGPVELKGFVKLDGYEFVPAHSSWEAAQISIDSEEHEACADPAGLVVDFWGLYPLDRRQGMYPKRPEGTTMYGIRSNPPCSELTVDPNWTKEKGHGDYMARECCITVYGLVIALPEGAFA